ncbi:hypothetical protein [Qipengyuania sp. JC766]|uniref:hypothetical protein n=1 Tax=Qipengyuania sp. JC766 TaxID=3232139 RepID=UPI0034588C4D
MEELSEDLLEPRYKVNRLWVPFRYANYESLALVDSGASVSVVPRRIAAGQPILENANVQTRLATRKEPVVALGPVEVAGSSFEKARFLAMRGRTCLLGLDLLLSRGSLSLGSWGVRFGGTAPAGKALGTVEIDTVHADAAYRSRITGLSLKVEIDGEQQACFLDTGRTSTLAATAALPVPSGSARKGLDIEFNGFGEFGLRRFHRRIAHVRIGTLERNIRFRHLHADKTASQPYVIGGGILKECDILLSPDDRIATFFPAGALRNV